MGRLIHVLAHSARPRLTLSFGWRFGFLHAHIFPHPIPRRKLEKIQTRTLPSQGFP